jgi:D-alanine--poly(phosphoribitol) ligase subunit 1
VRALAALYRHDPAGTAIVTPDGELTYGELTARIDAAAAALADAGAGPEQVCAVVAEAGVDAVTGMAAVLRAGAAFLTLDLDQPPARLADMIDSAGARFRLTTTALAAAGGRADLPIDGPTVLLDGPPGAGPLPAHPDPRTLAYVSHTSGSTGRPNAVLVERRSLDGYLTALVADCALDPGTVTLQVAPLGYDASVRDVFATLVAGGTLVLLPRSALLLPDAFAAAVATHRANTVLSSTPTLLTFLARDGLPAGLRLVVSSGESLRPFLLAGGRDRLAGRLLNHYGPSETTMTATRHDVPPGPPPDADLIGAPLPGVTAHVLDADLRPVRPGGTGEVYLGGTGVTRGYRGRPGVTATRFLPDPAGPPGARMYRTGDLARHRPDGVLEYLGRADRQVKIRGYRVDPAEVEGALLSHPAVTGAVVTPATDAAGRPHLVGHLTGDLTGVTDAALRAHLAQTLPPHLLPRRFLRVDRLPTTRTGKTDRTALTTGGAP